MCCRVLIFNTKSTSTDFVVPLLIKIEPFVLENCSAFKLSVLLPCVLVCLISSYDPYRGSRDARARDVAGAYGTYDRQVERDDSYRRDDPYRRDARDSYDHRYSQSVFNTNYVHSHFGKKNNQ